MFVALQQQADPLFLIPIIDEQSYVNDATNWANAGLSREGLNLPFWQQPGYMMILGVWIFSGGTVQGFMILQLLLGVASSWLIYRITLKIFGPASNLIATVSAIAFSFFPIILYFETKLLKSSFSIFLMLLIIFLFYRQTKLYRYLIAGLLSGLLVFIESYFIIIPIALLATGRTRLRGALVMIAAMTAVALPVIFLNAASSGSLIPGSYNGPINLYLGNNIDWIRTYNARPGWEWDRVNQNINPADAALGITAHDRSALFLDEVTSFMQNHPVLFIRGLFTKALMTFSAMEMPRNGAIFIPSSMALPGYAANALMVLLALLVMTRMKDPVLFLPIIFLLAINTGVFPTTRYRLPVIPLLLIAAGSLAVSRQPLRLKVMIPIALLLVSSGTWVAAHVIQHEKWRAFSLNDAAWFHINKGDMAKAKTLAWQSLQAAETPGGLNTSGMIAFGENGDTETAIRYFNQAIDMEPNYPDSYLNRALVQVKSNQRENAYHSYELFLEHVSIDRLGTTDYNYQSALSALSFIAQTDLDSVNLTNALNRFVEMRALHNRAGGTAADMSLLNEQIDSIQDILRQ